MCTKVPYADPWHAARAADSLRAKGKKVRGIHPCFADHRGQWHVTSKKARRKWASS